MVSYQLHNIIEGDTRPYVVEFTRCTTLCLYVLHCSTKSTI